MFFRRNSDAFVFHSIRKGTRKKKCRVSHCWYQEEKHKASCDNKAKTNPCRKVTASELLSTTPYIWLLTLHELKECRYTLKVETNQGLDNYSHIHLKSIEIWAIFRLIRIKLQLSWSHLADCCIFPCRRTPVMSDSMIGWQQCYAVGAVYFRCVASGAHLNYTISFERNLPDPPIQTVAQPHTHEWTYIIVLRAFVFSAKGRRDTSNTGQSSPIIAHFLCLTHAEIPLSQLSTLPSNRATQLQTAAITYKQGRPEFQSSQYYLEKRLERESQTKMSNKTVHRNTSRRMVFSSALRLFGQ